MSTTELAHHVAGPGLREVYVLVNVAIVGAIIYFAAWKSIKTMLINRKENIKKALLDGKQQLQAIQAEVQKIKSEMANLESLRARTIAETETESKSLANQMLEEAQGAAKKIIEDAQQAAENEIRAATSEVKKQIISEALKIAQKQLSTDLQKQTHSYLSQTAIEESGKA